MCLRSCGPSLNNSFTRYARKNMEIIQMRCRLYISEAPQALRLEKVNKSLATHLVPFICDLRGFMMPGGQSEARIRLLVI